MRNLLCLILLFAFLVPSTGFAVTVYGEVWIEDEDSESGYSPYTRGSLQIICAEEWQNEFAIDKDGETDLFSLPEGTCQMRVVLGEDEGEVVASTVTSVYFDSSAEILVLVIEWLDEVWQLTGFVE